MYISCEQIGACVSRYPPSCARKAAKLIGEGEENLEGKVKFLLRTSPPALLYPLASPRNPRGSSCFISDSDASVAATKTLSPPQRTLSSPIKAIMLSPRRDNGENGGRETFPPFPLTISGILPLRAARDRSREEIDKFIELLGKRHVFLMKNYIAFVFFIGKKCLFKSIYEFVESISIENSLDSIPKPLNSVQNRADSE